MTKKTSVRLLSRAAALLGAGLVAACMHGMGMERPADSEFGTGPRLSSGGLYEATLEPAEPLRVGRMQRAKLTLRAKGRAPAENAAITVDGGMPQHGHGLPTTPRVTRSLGEGAYQVDGLKFIMGGWWELRFRVTSAAGTDSVTFNLEL